MLTAPPQRLRLRGRLGAPRLPGTAHARIARLPDQAGIVAAYARAALSLAWPQRLSA
jgi:hypothetical protein